MSNWLAATLLLAAFLGGAVAILALPPSRAPGSKGYARLGGQDGLIVGLLAFAVLAGLAFIYVLLT